MKLVDVRPRRRVHTASCLRQRQFPGNVACNLRCSVLASKAAKVAHIPPMASLNLAFQTTVLVVDDSFEIQRYCRTLLELDSYRVVTTSSGYEALELLRQGCTPAVVLLDLQMP